jgi:hypothetical protein
MVSLHHPLSCNHVDRKMYLDGRIESNDTFIFRRLTDRRTQKAMFKYRQKLGFIPTNRSPIELCAILTTTGNISKSRTL